MSSSRPGRQTRAAAGFTLLEALLAVAILAVACVAVFSILGEGIGRTHAAADRRNAVLLAESLLARAANDLRASTSGRDNSGLSWHLTVRPYSRDSRADQGLRLVEVTAEVTWRAGGSAQRLQISSLRADLP